jgi:hypothetical protein
VFVTAEHQGTSRVNTTPAADADHSRPPKALRKFFDQSFAIIKINRCSYLFGQMRDVKIPDDLCERFVGRSGLFARNAEDLAAKDGSAARGDEINGKSGRSFLDLISIDRVVEPQIPTRLFPMAFCGFENVPVDRRFFKIEILRNWPLSVA